MISIKSDLDNPYQVSRELFIQSFQETHFPSFRNCKKKRLKLEMELEHSVFGSAMFLLFPMAFCINEIMFDIIFEVVSLFSKDF